MIRLWALDTKIFHSILSHLNSRLTLFIILFSQEKPLRWKERNTHKHWLHLLEILCKSNFSNHAQNIEVISHICQRIGFQTKLYSIVTELSFLPSFAITEKNLEIWCNLPTDALVPRFSHTRRWLCCLLFRQSLVPHKEICLHIQRRI